MLPFLSSSLSHHLGVVTPPGLRFFQAFFLDPWEPWSNEATSNIWHIPPSKRTDEVNVNDGWGSILTRGAFKYSWTTSWRPVIIDLWVWFDPLELGVILLPCFGTSFSMIVPDIFLIDLFGLGPKKDNSQETLKEFHGNHPTWFLYSWSMRWPCVFCAWRVLSWQGLLRNWTRARWKWVENWSTWV